jgi:hypothetical protein
MAQRWYEQRGAATHEQALAALFHRSGWTQEELAKKEGRERRYIGRQLVFGRFLSFGPMGPNLESTPKNLTERKFRSYWEQTDKSPNERSRFMRVLELIKLDTVSNASYGGAVSNGGDDGRPHQCRAAAPLHRTPEGKRDWR